MSIRKSLAGAMVALAVVPALTAAPAAFAQSSPPTQAQQRPERPSHIEGRLAFLKTELKITDAQAAQWDALAAVMRQNEQARRERFRQMRASFDQQRQTPTSAIERLEAGQRASEARNQEMRQFIAAFRPLYAALSDEQKKTADELFAHRGHHHRMHGRF